MAVLGLRYHYPSSQAKRFILINLAEVGPIAQSVEQRTFNPWVDGSSPSGPTQMRRFLPHELLLICTRFMISAPY